MAILTSILLETEVKHMVLHRGQERTLTKQRLLIYQREAVHQWHFFRIRTKAEA